MPFSTMDGAGFPVPVLAQVSKKLFEICVPFRYRRNVDSTWVVVPKNEEFRCTDLASVPGFLLWFVPRYGAHTLAALLHDQLVDDPPDGNRVTADTIFRDALGELNVPWIRRWLMWAAVSIGTTFKVGFFGAARVVVWGVAVVTSATFIWQHALAAITRLEPWSFGPFGRSLLTDVALVIAFALVLFPRIGLGWLAGTGILFIFPATVPILVTLLVYLGLEWVSKKGLEGYNSFARRTSLRAVDTVPVLMTRSGPNLATSETVPRGCPELKPQAPGNQ